MLTQSFEETLEQEVAWERAARFVDVDPLALRRLREPRLECVVRVPCGSDTALLHVAAGAVVSTETVTAITVGPRLTEVSAREALADVECDAALVGEFRSTAAIALQVPDGIHERALWECARDCAPAVSRLLGATTFLPSDFASAVFARWLCAGAVGYGKRCSVQNEVEHSMERTADAMVASASFALRAHHKLLQGASVAVVGSGTMARGAMRAFSEAGARLITVVDASGAVVEPKGLQAAGLLAHIEAGGLVAEYADAQHALRSEALAVASDLVIFGDASRLETGSGLKAKAVLISPGVKSTEGWMAALEESGVTVIPEALSRSVRLLPETDGKELRRRLESIWEKLKDLCERHNVSLDFAVRAYVLRKLAERERWDRP